MDFFFWEKKGNWLFRASRRIRTFEKKRSQLVRASRRNFDPKNRWRGLKASSVFKVEQGRDGADGIDLEGKGSWPIGASGWDFFG